eukprot:jgi/Picre1/33589/NNA_001069.t1
MLRVSLLFLCFTFLARTNWLARWKTQGKKEKISQEISAAAPLQIKSLKLEKFLQIRLCKGLCNQILALQEGIFLSHLLNLTFVLPDVVWDYGPGAELNKLDPTVEKYDHWRDSKVPLEELFDPATLIHSFQGHVKIVKQLPKNLEQHGAPSLRVSSVNPQWGSSLQYYKNHLSANRVLRLTCPLLSMKTNTVKGGILHKTLLNGLNLSDSLQSYLPERQKRQLGLHLRVEDDWRDFCQQESQNTERTWVKSFESCYKSPSVVVDMLHHMRLYEKYPRLYVATGDMSFELARELVRIGFQEVESFSLRCNPVCLEKTQHLSPNLGREARAAIDLFTMVNSEGFIGNIFSSFSLLVRQFRSFRASSRGETQFYNYEGYFDGQDLIPMETRRTLIFPGILHPEAYCGSWRRTANSLKLCGNTSDCPIIKSIIVEKIDRGSDLEGLALIKGKMIMNVLHWYPPIQVLIGGQVVSEFIANDVLSDPKNPYEIPLRFEVPHEINDTNIEGSLQAQICAGCYSYRKCSKQHTKVLRRPLQSLHRIHQIINLLFAKQQIDIESVFPTHVQFYKNKFSHYVTEFDPTMLTSSDYVLFPEGAKVNAWWPHVFDELGVIPLVIYLGQHHQFLEDTILTRQFNSICLTKYFAKLYHCSFSAVLNTNLNPKFIRDSWKTHANKTNTILIDPDPEYNLDIARIKVPPNANIVVMSHMSQEEVILAYQHAKLYIDSFLTGRERGVFESLMYDVVPVVGLHAGAKVFEDYPLPAKYKWSLHNYEELNNLIDYVLQNHDEAIKDFRPMKEYVRGMEHKLQESAEQYFSDNFLIVLSGMSNSSRESLGLHTDLALITLISCKDLFPFAGVEIIVPNSLYFQFEHANFFHEIRERHHRFDVITASISPEVVRYGQTGFYFQTPSTKHTYPYYVYIGEPRPFLNRKLIRLLVRALRSSQDIDFVKCGSSIAMTREAQAMMQNGIWKLLEEIC